MGGGFAGQILALWSGQGSSLPFCRAFLARLVRNGNGLDLDHYFGPKEAADLDERAGRRSLRVDVLVTDRAYDRDAAHVGQEVVQLDDVAPRGAGGLERVGQVLEDPAGLGLEVPFADELSLAVERDLAGDIDDSLGRRVDHMAVAERPRQRGRREKARLGHWGACYLGKA